MASQKAGRLVRLWGLDVREARHSDWGNFYNTLSRFPAALLDANGDYPVPTEDALSIPGIRVTKKINVPGLIPTLPGYVRMHVMTHYPEDNGSGKQPSVSAGFSNAEQNRKIDVSAVRFVGKAYRKEGWEVVSVEQKRCGFDLLCV